MPTSTAPAVEPRPREQRSSSCCPPPTPRARSETTKDIYKFYHLEREDFDNAKRAFAVKDKIEKSETDRRLRAITGKQEQEHQQVCEAQMMQAMEFNSAWSQNMTEFERQANDIYQGAQRRQSEEFEKFKAKLPSLAPNYRPSKELLNLRRSLQTCAKATKYDEATKIKRRVRPRADARCFASASSSLRPRPLRVPGARC